MTQHSLRTAYHSPLITHHSSLTTHHSEFVILLAFGKQSGGGSKNERPGSLRSHDLALGRRNSPPERTQRHLIHKLSPLITHHSPLTTHHSPNRTPDARVVPEAGVLVFGAG